MKHFKRTSNLILGFLTVVAFTLASCQKEDITEEHSINNKVKSELKIVKLTSNDITQNKGVTQKLNFFTETLKTRQQNKTVYSSEHDFYINTDFVTYIEKANGLHTYTFPVQYANETGEINNLVLHSQEDGSYNAIYVSYDVIESEKALINQGTPVDLEGKVSIALINDTTFIDTLFAKVTTYDQCLEPDYSIGPCNAGYSYDHEPEVFSGYSGGMCSGSTYTLVGLGYDMDCVNALDWGSPGNVATSTGTSPNGTSNGGGLTTSDTDPLTTPVTCEGCPEVDDEEDCVTNDTTTADLESVFGVGNFEKDCTTDPSNIPEELRFETLEELQAFKDSFNNIIAEQDGAGVLSDDGTTAYSNFKFSTYLLTFTVNVEQLVGTDYVNYEDYEIVKVQSSVGGISAFVTYNQTSNIAPTKNVTALVNTVEVYGNCAIHIWYDGAVEITSGQMYFNVKMNIKDGDEVSGTMN